MRTKLPPVLIALAVLAPCAVHAQCVAPPSGIVAWWTGNGTVQDSIGTNTLSLTGGITYAAGEVGLAFSLDGTSGFADALASPSLNVGTGSGLTIEAWINPASLDEQPIVEWNNGSAEGSHFWLSVPPSPGNGPGCLSANLVDTTGTSHYIASPADLVMANTFQHVGLTYDHNSGNAAIYFNGQPVAQTNLGVFTPQTSYNIFLGDRPGGTPPLVSYGGLLDEVSLYGRALSAGEISNIFAAGSAGKCSSGNCVAPTDGLVSWWQAESNTLDTLNNNNGTAEGISYATGVIGLAFSFDGSSYVDVPNPTFNAYSDGFTVAAWIYISSYSEGSPVINLRTPANSSGFTLEQLYGNNGSLQMAVYQGGVANQFVALYSAGWPLNVFTHVAASFDAASGTLSIYRNGILVASTNGLPNTSMATLGTDACEIGRNIVYNPFAWQGLIDQVRFYGRVLSASEVQSLACSTATLLWNPTIQSRSADFGVKNNQFGFNITGSTNLVVVVAASTNLANAVWTPLQTVTLTNGSSYFSDPGWTNYSARFYMLQMP